MKEGRTDKKIAICSLKVEDINTVLCSLERILKLMFAFTCSRVNIKTHHKTDILSLS